MRSMECEAVSCGATSELVENSILNSLVGRTKTNIVLPSLNGLDSPFGLPADGRTTSYTDQQRVPRLGKSSFSVSKTKTSWVPPRRFSASRLAAHRAKLGLSAAAYGKLVGMSGATIYLWEQEKSRPSSEQLQRLATVRSLSRREALERAST